MDDIRAASPTDHVLDGLELLHRLSLVDDSDVPWIHPEAQYYEKLTEERSGANSFPFDEEAEAVDRSMYDPSLFSPSASQPSSPSRAAFAFSGSRDKPLPVPPSTYRQSSPSTPRLTPASTPSSSPRASLSPSQPLSRSRPPSTNMGAPRSLHTHGAFPSISSTLSLLEERETEAAKRSGVLVHPDEAGGRALRDSAVLLPASARKDSVESLKVPEFAPRHARPTLNLATSVSSPQLRALADLAGVPASPISVKSTHSVAHKPSLVSLTPSVSSPLASSSILLPPTPLEEELPSSSRWSMDSVDPDAGRPIIASPSTPPSPPAKKRSRLLSFISRGRAGSLTKRDGMPSVDADGLLTPQDTVPPTPSSPSVNSVALSSRRTSRSGSYPPPPMSLSTSASTASMASTLPTPADSQPDIALDPFCPASPTFAPASFLPDADADDFLEMGDGSPPPRAPLPLPAPDAPPAAFVAAPASAPAQPSGNPLLALARRKLRRRKKKLVVTLDAPALGPAEDAGAVREQRRRQDGVVRWCEDLGGVRRIERKQDGSLHVYWRDADVVDMACSVSGKVYLKGVGRVNLVWQYL